MSSVEYGAAEEIDGGIALIRVMDGRAVNDGRGEGDGRRCDD